MNIVNAEIKGVRPYLMHRFVQEDANAQKRKIGKTDYKAEAEKALYRDGDGRIYVPSTQLEAAMTQAAKNFPVPGQRGKKWTEVIMSSVVVGPGDIPIDPQAYTVHEVPGRIPPRTGARVMIYRPMWKDWTLKFKMEILEDQLPLSVLNEILVFAGQRKGIGDWRPKFGTFMVSKFEEEV